MKALLVKQLLSTVLDNPLLRGFLKDLHLAETPIPVQYISAEISALQQHLAQNGQELRRIQEKKSGFTVYVVVKSSEPPLLGNVPGTKHVTAASQN